MASYENSRIVAVPPINFPNVKEFIVIGADIVTLFAVSINTSSVGEGTTSVFQFKGSDQDTASPPPSQKIVASALEIIVRSVGPAINPITNINTKTTDIIVIRLCIKDLSFFFTAFNLIGKSNINI
jgi:hypothetical protein